MIYLSTAIGMTPGGSGTVHIYTQTMHRTTQLTTKQYEQQTTQTTNMEHCWPCPVFASFTLAFARKKHGKTSVRVAEGIVFDYLCDNYSTFVTFFVVYDKSV
jgi:hypothetical protein